MKKVLSIIVALIILLILWDGESRRFVSFTNGKHLTVWKTFNNTCYIIIGRYYGFFEPSSNYTYIKTKRVKSSGVDLIWKEKSDSIFAQVDSGSILFNSPTEKSLLVNYDSNRIYNDSLFTYYDPHLHLNLYKKGLDIVAISFDDMGAL
jgi:hypothetical protein